VSISFETTANATTEEAALARLYAAEAAREREDGRVDAAAFWWTQALVMALVADERGIVATARGQLRAARRLD
jgi:hypothetical protein